MAASREKAMLAVQSIFDRYVCRAVPSNARRLSLTNRWNLISKDTAFKGFDSYVMTQSKLLDASLGPPPSIALAPAGSVPSPAVLASSTCSLVIDQQFGNLNGVMHGGAYGVVFDMLTTVALGPLSRPGFWEYVPR